MTPSYYVFSLKMVNWWGLASVWTSDLKQAKLFTHEEAIAFCKKRYTANTDSLEAVPVSEDDVLAVKQK